MAYRFAANANANSSASQWNQYQANSNHYQTPIKHSTVHPKQIQYNDSLLRWIQVFE